MFIAKVKVTLKPSVLDPQGQAVLRSLVDQGLSTIADLRVGKYIELKLDVSSLAEAETQAKTICESMLVNSVIETYQLSVEAV